MEAYMEEQDEELYVAVPEKSKEGMPVLLWVLRNAPRDVKIVITHVYLFDQMIPAPLGGRVHPSMASELELVAYRQEEKAKAARKLDEYTKQCSKAHIKAWWRHKKWRHWNSPFLLWVLQTITFLAMNIRKPLSKENVGQAQQFKWEKLVHGSNDIEKGILELIQLKGIKKLIMGATENRRYSMRMIEPTFSKAKSVMKSADPSCKVWFVCSGNLIYTREANQEILMKSPVQCSCGLSQGQAGNQEQYTHNYARSSDSSPRTSYRISDTGSLFNAFVTEVDAALGADIELKDALTDLTLIVQKVEDSISRQNRRMEHEVESLKAKLNEKDKLLQEANKQNEAFEYRVMQLEETLASVNGSTNIRQSEN